MDSEDFIAELRAIEGSEPSVRVAERLRQAAADNAGDRDDIARERAALSKRIVEAAIAGLDDSYELTYVDYRSVLTDEQIQKLLDSADGYYYVADETDEWADDQRYDAARQIIEDDVLPDDELRGVVDEHPDDWDELRFAIQERDRSNPVADMLRNTGSKLMQISFDYDVPDWTQRTDADVDEAVAGICEVTGLNPVTNRDGIVTALAEASYGGVLKLIVYADPADAIGATELRVTNPHLLIHDNLNGSGGEFTAVGTIVLPISYGTVRLDSQAPGYGWDKIAAVHGPAYTPDTITWTKPAPTEQDPS